MQVASSLVKKYPNQCIKSDMIQIQLDLDIIENLKITKWDSTGLSLNCVSITIYYCHLGILFFSAIK